MPRRFVWLVIATSLVTVALASQVGCRGADEQDAGTVQDSERTIHVEAVPIRQARMGRTRTLFGTLSPLSSTLHSYSLPFEIRIDRLHVSDGQHVEAGDALFDSGRSLAATVAAQGASDLLKEAEMSLQQVRGRNADGLATRGELIQAEGRFRRATQQVEAMRASGQLDEHRTTRAILSGVVSNPGNQVGALIPPGAAVVNIAEDASIGVQLWAEPGIAHSIRPGMKVAVSALGDVSSTPWEGRVLRVDDRVDSLSRLVRVLVVLAEPGSLLLGQNVRGQVEVSDAEGLVVPRESLVSSDGRTWIYVVDRGRARAKRVDVLVEGHEEVLVRADGIEEGARVITRGAYQAEEGLRVVIDR